MYTSFSLRTVSLPVRFRHARSNSRQSRMCGGSVYRSGGRSTSNDACTRYPRCTQNWGTSSKAAPSSSRGSSAGAGAEVLEEDGVAGKEEKHLLRSALHRHTHAPRGAKTSWACRWSAERKHRRGPTLPPGMNKGFEDDIIF